MRLSDRRHLANAIMLALLIGSPSAIAAGYSTYTLLPCGDFLKVGRSEAQRLYEEGIVANFARGYLTAHNLYNPKKQIVRDLSNSTIVLFVEKHCRENPLDDVAYAIPPLAMQLGGVRLPPP